MAFVAIAKTCARIDGQEVPLSHVPFHLPHCKKLGRILVLEIDGLLVLLLVV
jgi:hypothetical protein